METIRDQVAKMTRRQLDAQTAAAAHGAALKSETETATGVARGTSDAGATTVSTSGR